MLKTIHNKIQQGFSAAAKQYDLNTRLHRDIADKLFARVITELEPSTLLDVGCGTGYLTGALKNHFPLAKVTGLDFAQGMIDVARSKHEGIDWILADGNDLPFADGNFDVVVSNLAYQWAGNLARAFFEAKRVMASNGIFACTLFGYNTCQELFQSLNESRPGAVQFTRLPDQSQVLEALVASGFENPKVDSEQMRIEFKDMHELLAWFKAIGANHLPRDGYLGREMMSQTVAIYRTNFPYLQGIGATFEVIQIYAKK
jgi:malonyl-CoA O-methyltransferase